MNRDHDKTRSGRLTSPQQASDDIALDTDASPEAITQSAAEGPAPRQPQRQQRIRRIVETPAEVGRALERAERLERLAEGWAGSLISKGIRDEPTLVAKLLDVARAKGKPLDVDMAQHIAQYILAKDDRRRDVTWKINQLFTKEDEPYHRLVFFGVVWHWQSKGTHTPPDPAEWFGLDHRSIAREAGIPPTYNKLKAALDHWVARGYLETDIRRSPNNKQRPMKWGRFVGPPASTLRKHLA